MSANTEGLITAPAAEYADEYVIQALDDPDYEGWFPLGEVSLVAGSSGTGKTTWILQVLEQVRQGQNVFGHRTQARRYCVLLHDRSKRSFRRTLRRMRLPHDVEHCVHRLTPEQQRQKPHEVVEEIVRSNPSCEVIVIEGLDMWAPAGKASSDLVSMAAFLDDLQRIAEQYNVAIIGTCGSPKMKPRDRYEMQRDSVIGSSAIGRKVETIVYLQLANLKDPNSIRECTVLTRQGKSEKFTFRFQRGRLLDETEMPTPAPQVAPMTRFELYLATLKVGELVHWTPESGMSESTFKHSIKAASREGLIFKNQGHWYKAAEA